MPSFLPDYPPINALTSCPNWTNCGNKDARAFTLKMCTPCRSVSYCNVDCQKTHRKYHKHQCKQEAKQVKEMKESMLTMMQQQQQGIEENTDDDDNDDELFQPIPPEDDCPICTLPLPIKREVHTYSTCCGNTICMGCSLEDARITEERGLHPRCAFCREPHPSSYNEGFVRIKKQMEMNNSVAINMMSHCYTSGAYGRPIDPQLAFDLCLRAADLGNSDACHRAAAYYSNNSASVVEKDMTKSLEYNKKAIRRGHILARYNLGSNEMKNKGNFRLACKHWLISAAAGHAKSLEAIADFFKIDIVTKKEYSSALASYRKVHKAEWSIDREKVEAI